MKLSNLALTASLALTTLSCSSMSIKHDYDSQFNFQPLKTFDLVAQPLAVEKALARRGFLDKRIRASIESELSNKGYQTSTNPDFVVSYHVGVRKEIDVKTTGYRYGRRRPGRGRAVRVAETTTEGSLTIDIVEFQTKELIWRGLAEDAVDESASGEEKQKKLNEAVTKMLEKFPP